MKKLIYLVSYLCLIIVWIIFILIVLELLNIVNSLGQISLIAIPFGYIYHKLKPMPFSEVILKFTGIKLPTWETIKYKFMILIGTDPDSLKEPKDKEDKGDR